MTKAERELADLEVKADCRKAKTGGKQECLQINDLSRILAKSAIRPNCSTPGEVGTRSRGQ
jgi:hypothetical protein